MLVTTTKKVQLVLDKNITVEIDDKQAEHLTALGLVERSAPKAKADKDKKGK